MSLLGGGGGLGLSGSATSGASTGGVGPITVNAGSNAGEISKQTLFIIAGIVLAGLLGLALIFRAR
jgi:hypothetical protein